MNTAWIGVIGALGGSALTFLGNMINNRYLLRKDRETREWEEKKSQDEREARLKADKFKVYNAVLKEDGEHEYVRESESSELKLKIFDKVRYVNNMRPILMSDLHLLSRDVFLFVRKMDSYTYDDLNYIEPDEWSNEMANDYIKLIAEIEREYQMPL
ncbi:hypothetical protein M3664_04690 [Paenibacillus lautus]|uniref:hypothetical protein n=1 Tax=Paenibacillus lautus TaxID=1401 RepID=UPI00204028AC|nr:hypothetical protein [Paenibacillus lautus]MCM3257079.1 hypothetical protein [Paenibacillus lautus]